MAGRRKGWIFPLQLRGDLLRQVEDGGVPDEVGEDEVGNPRLAHAGEVARPADPEVLLGDPEAVDGLLHDGQARRRFLSLLSSRHQEAGRRAGPAPDPSAQLVKLREAEPLRVLDDHHRRLRDVHPHFDDRGRDEQLEVAPLEPPHRLFLLRRLHPAVQQPHPDAGERFPETLGGARGVPQGDLVGLLHQREDDVRPPSPRDLPADLLEDLPPTVLRDDLRADRNPSARHLVEHRDVEVSVQRDRERPRDRRGGHDEEVRGDPSFPAEGGTLENPEPVLLVDHSQRQVAERDALLDQGMRSHDDVRLPVPDPFPNRFALLRRQRGGKERDPDRQSRRPFQEPPVMLLRQDLRGRHHRGLHAVPPGDHRGDPGDDRLAAAHVPLQEPVHRDAASRGLSGSR